MGIGSQKLVLLLVLAASVTVAGCGGPHVEPQTSAPRDAAATGWRLVVLGIAQDGGMPHLGCMRERCESARRGDRPEAKVVCLGLTDGERVYLFDATPDFPAQVHAMGVRKPDAIFLTHAHIGHYTGLVHLGKEVLGARGVPVYASERMRGFLRDNGPWSALVENGNIDLRDNARVDLGGVTVTAFFVPHRQEFSDTVGYRIEGPRKTALFLPDIDSWDEWDEDVRKQVEAVDYAFLDGTFFSIDELPHRDITKVKHPLVPDTMDRLEGLGGKVWFVHLNHTNPLYDDDAPVTKRGFHLAREGETLPL